MPCVYCDQGPDGGVWICSDDMPDCGPSVALVRATRKRKTKKWRKWPGNRTRKATRLECRKLKCGTYCVGYRVKDGQCEVRLFRRKAPGKKWQDLGCMTVEDGSYDIYCIEGAVPEVVLWQVKKCRD